MNYLITGGLGLIGSELANTLSGSITVVSRTDKRAWRIRNPKVKIVLKTLSELTARDLRSIDVIYHCASTVDNYSVLDDPYVDVETNIKGTIHLLELCKDMKKKPKLIFLSTFFVYGNTYDIYGEPITETSRTQPLALYPATKLCAEACVRLYSKLYDIPIVIARLTNVYGEYEEYDNKKKGALNYMIMLALKGEPMNVYKGGNFVRDYIYVTDVVSALMLLERKARDDLYLVGSGEQTQFKHLVECMLKESDKKSTLTPIDPPPFHTIVGINNFVADVSKLRKLGWRPQVTVSDGIHRIAQRYKGLISSD